MDELEQFRADKDTWMRTAPNGPLTPEQQASFAGLSYFPENAALRFAATVERSAADDEIVVATSTGDERLLRRYGRFRFEVEGQLAELTIYEAAHGFFLPFVDSLAGTETYGAGRYLEPEPLDENTFLVDFNVAYNPYCAYNDRWSCPLTPFENRVAVPIRAGEKLYEKAEG